MEENTENLLDKLAIADPEIAEMVATGLAEQEDPLSLSILSLLVDDVIWALAHEHSFGLAMATGYISLVPAVEKNEIEKYHQVVRKAGEEGPTFGRILSEHLAPVIIAGGHRFWEPFLQTIEIMKSKGLYTLQGPLAVLTFLMQTKDVESGSAYMDLLQTTFRKELTYSQSQHFAGILPKSVISFSPSRRVWQIRQLNRVIDIDFHLADYFLDGMEKGLYLLSEDSLERFVSEGLDKYRENVRRGNKFLSLDSKLGRDIFMRMQVTVPLAQVQHQLTRYIRARTGMPISIKPLSTLSESFYKADNGLPTVRSDGKSIYLPNEIGFFDTKEENLNLYKGLARFEAGHYEFNSLDFDLEKAMSRGLRRWTGGEHTQQDALSDLEFFLNAFSDNELAEDLFTIFEHGRLRLHLEKRYPGLIRKTLPLLQAEADRLQQGMDHIDIVFKLYLHIALGMPFGEDSILDPVRKKTTALIVRQFEETMCVHKDVEACALLVDSAYRKLRKENGGDDNNALPGQLRTPFDRKIRPDLHFSTYRHYDRMASVIKVRLEQKGLRVYKSDIKKRLIKKEGNMLQNDLAELILHHENPAGSDYHSDRETILQLSGVDLEGLLGHSIKAQLTAESTLCPATWYREWSADINDYLHDHVRVLDKLVEGAGNGFYAETVKQYRGLVKQIRYSFELLKPEALSILRQWIEGDEFDYRALFDFAMDKKAGLLPSDRLYIKRIKKLRDVTVLLLVDLSRSTSNYVAGSRKTVLDVEKEAIVLFCEALQVIGDTYGIAGFSGTGRFGVDYFRIKNFNDRMDETIQTRIGSMAPQRSTRMGAAIRHAVAQLEALSSRVRLLIIIGDGFPNDVDYKQGYAIEDTRKAITEARSKNLYVHGITVNLAGDPRLDDLYGNVHHNVISDVRELPDKLLRIYSSLTR